VRRVTGERAARIVAPEMGVLPSPEVAGWNTHDALESLGVLMKKHHVAGGAVWQWVAVDATEELNPNASEAVKRRGPGLVYTPLADVLVDLAGYHPAAVPDGSFEEMPSRWTTSGAGTASRVENVDPLRPWRGMHFLRIAGAQVTSEPFEVWPGVPTTLTAHLRVAAGQQAFVEIVHASSSQRFEVTQATTGFAAFPVRFTPPAGALRARVRIGAVGTVEVDHVH